MTTKEATVRNGHGIHCRPSAVIAQKAQEFASSVTVNANGTTANGKEILSLIGLGLGQNATVEVQAEGEDEEEACTTIAELFETEFDFPPRE